MKKLLLILVLAVMCSSVARAGDSEDAEKAYQKGDYATALKLWRPLAEKGGSSAQYNLALMYHFGKGATQNYQEAEKWYRKAAEQENEDAQYNLGVMYEKGDGVIQDYKESIKWYRKAAEIGLPQAQVSLGLMYIKGNGAPHDILRGYMWLSLATIGGDRNGQKGIQAISEHLTPAQLTEAEEMILDCFKKKSKDKKENCEEIEWTKVSENEEGMISYVNFEEIKKHDGYIYFWEMRNFLEPGEIRTRPLSAKAYTQCDCKLFRIKNLSYSFYKERWAGGGEVGDRISPEKPEWIYPDPNTILEAMIKKVCAAVGL